MKKPLVTQSEVKADWRTVVAQHVAQPLGAGEFTSTMISEEYGITWNQARALIARLIHDGQIVSVGKRRREGHKPEVAYRVAG